MKEAHCVYCNRVFIPKFSYDNTCSDECEKQDERGIEVEFLDNKNEELDEIYKLDGYLDDRDRMALDN